MKSKEAEDQEFKADHQEYLQALNEYNEKKAEAGEATEMVAINWVSKFQVNKFNITKW